jgi:hypothetical protein
VIDDQRLGDHAAHRHPHHVGPLDAQLGQQRGGIVGHVLNPVGRRGAVTAEEGDEVGDALELRRQADVAVVVADGEETAAGQLLDETLGPGGQLPTQSHHEEERGIRRIPVGHVLDVDPVDVHGGHCRLPWS